MRAVPFMKSLLRLFDISRREEIQNSLSLCLSLAVSLIGPILTIPALVTLWGKAEAGLWLMAIGFSAYISLVDFGASQWLSNSLPQCYARGGHAAAKDIQDGYLRSWLQLWIPIGLVGGALLWWIITPPLEGFAAAGHADFRAWMGVVASLCGVLAIPSAVTSSTLRGTGRYHLSVYWTMEWRLLEIVAALVVAYAGYNVLCALGLTCVLRLVQFFHGLKLAGIKIFEMGLISYKDACSYIYKGFPTGAPWVLMLVVNVINFQLITNIVANKFGFEASAIFAFNRTCSRVITQVAGAGYNGYWPIITKLIELQQIVEIRAKYRHLQWLTAGMVVALLAALVGAYLFSDAYLPKYRELLEPALLAWLAVGAVFAAASGSVAVVLFASNKTVQYGSTQMVVLIAVCLGIGELAKTSSLVDVAKVLAAAEALVFCNSILQAKRFFANLSASPR